MARLAPASPSRTQGGAHNSHRADWPAVFTLGFFQLGWFFVFTHLAVALVPAVVPPAGTAKLPPERAARGPGDDDGPDGPVTFMASDSSS